MVFYTIILFIVSTGLIYDVVSFVKERRNAADSKTKFADFWRKVLIDIFVMAFCLKKLFPGITWL